MRDKVLIFGGTTEGRTLAKKLTDANILHYVSVATDYGKEIEEQAGEHNLFVGRKDAEEIRKLIAEYGFSVVVDATHPYATRASEEISRACREEEVTCLRLSRSAEALAVGNSACPKKCDFVITADSACDAALKLEQIPGNILLLTGSRDINEITGCISDVSRVFARVLPNDVSIAKCKEAGLSGRQIIAMQGPFSTQMNISLIKETEASVILTKNSGRTGGFEEKLEAAKKCGIKAVVINNPEEMAPDKNACSMDEVMEKILEIIGAGSASGKDICPCSEEEEDMRPKITLAGIGPAGNEYYTEEFNRALSEADVIFGAEAVVNRLCDIQVPVITEYEGRRILGFLSGSSYKNPMVVFSGDISLYSAEKKAGEILKKAGYRVRRICGISSVTLFAQRLDVTLEDTRIVSAHGRKCNVPGHVLHSSKVMALLTGAEQAKEIMDEIYKTDGLTVRAFLGHELGSNDERIIEAPFDERDISGMTGKCILYIENESAATRPVVRRIADEEFIRGKVPMTKEEVRAISIRKLELYPGAVLYDVGAGTGSVSVEAALLSPDIEVYAIEKNPEAARLIAQNSSKFGAVNVHVIEGEAPSAMDGLPRPSHFFVGGSSGRIREIIEKAWSLNAAARIVINCVTPETISEVMGIIDDKKIEDADILQAGCSVFYKRGSYHLPDAHSPVYVITLKGGSRLE